MALHTKKNKEIMNKKMKNIDIFSQRDIATINAICYNKHNIKISACEKRSVLRNLQTNGILALILGSKISFSISSAIIVKFCFRIYIIDHLGTSRKSTFNENFNSFLKILLLYALSNEIGATL